METESIEPFNGYAFFSDGADSLVVDPDLSPSNVQQGASAQRESVQSEQRRAELEALFSFTADGAPDARVPSPVAVYPNPFYNSTVFRYDLTDAVDVELMVFDALGRRVETLIIGHQSLGEQEVVWRPEGLPSGVYFYRLQAGEMERTGRVVLTR